MNKSFLGYSLWTIFLLLVTSSCSKEKEAEAKVDVSTQWIIDPFGAVVSAPNDDQWSKKTFTTSELGLFTDMDTANLAGTTLPTTIREASNYIFPNPFANNHGLAFRFNDNFSGEVVLKYIVIDSRLNVMEKKLARLTSRSGYGAVMIAPNLPAGKYRLYYTLSSQGNAHFYKSWGNIQKVN